MVGKLEHACGNDEYQLNKNCLLGNTPPILVRDVQAGVIRCEPGDDVEFQSRPMHTYDSIESDGPLFRSRLEFYDSDSNSDLHDRDDMGRLIFHRYVITGIGGFRSIVLPTH